MKYKGWECRVLKENNTTQAYIEVDRGNEYARGWVDKADIENYKHVLILMNREGQDMICDNCSHNEICTHKEDCNMLELSTKHYKLDVLFTVEIKCRHFNAIIQTPKTSLDSYQIP